LKDTLAVKVEERSEMEVSSLPMEFEAKNGDASLITEAMKQEEEKLQEARVKEDEEAAKSSRLDPNFKFSKLDELLTQTQLYSEFLLERMENITVVSIFQYLHSILFREETNAKYYLLLAFLRIDVSLWWKLGL
jgi:hypothetical protein